MISFLQEVVYLFWSVDAILNFITSIKKYVPVTKTWIKFAHMSDYRGCYSFCAFMDNIFVFKSILKGISNALNILNSYLNFKTTNKVWKNSQE